MVLSEAKQIKEAIEVAYQYEGKYYPPKADDITEHLKRNCIDYDVPTPYKLKGYEQSFDNSLIVIYYNDNSVLIVSSSGIDAPM